MKSSVLRNTLIGVLAILVGVLLVAVGFLGRTLMEPGGIKAALAAPPVPRPVATDFAVIPEIATILGTDFVEANKVTPDAMRDGAIKGMFSALGDSHSQYLSPQEYALSKGDFEGAFEGIGATVAKQGDFLVIVRPIPNSPADKAGLKPGDTILKVNDEDAKGWTVEQGVLRIRGPRGTTVRIQIKHADGTQADLSIKRDSIAVESVSTDPPGGALKDAAGNAVTDLAYIRIRSFTRTTPDEFRKAVKAAETAKAKGILLDLRGNPGGLLKETAEIADMFLDKGTIVTSVDRDGHEDTISATAGTITSLPVVIMQDEFSASGSEVLASALKENGRAKVVGSRSFGKGTVNHIRELSNGGAVYVSIARWLTPARNQIEANGVTPDYPITLTQDDITALRDPAAFTAIDLLHGVPVTPAPQPAPRTTATPGATGPRGATGASGATGSR